MPAFSPWWVVAHVPPRLTATMKFDNLTQRMGKNGVSGGHAQPYESMMLANDILRSPLAVGRQAVVDEEITGQALV